MSTHLPQHHPEFWKEKWVALSSTEKKILHSVREAVYAIQNPSELERIQTADIIQDVKQRVSKNLAPLFDKKIEKAISKALEFQAKQYKHITQERFDHRRKNGKLERDFIFLLKAGQFLNQYTADTMWDIVRLMTSGWLYPGLDKSKSLRSMRVFLESVQSHMKEKKFKKFLDRCRNIGDQEESFEE